MLQPGESERLAPYLANAVVDGVGHSFVCGFWLECSGCYLKVCCAVLFLVLWKRRDFFLPNPLWRFWITGFFNSMSVWYMNQKESPGDSPLCCSMGPGFPAGVPFSLHLQSLLLFVQGFLIAISWNSRGSRSNQLYHRWKLDWDCFFFFYGRKHRIEIKIHK